LSRPHEANRVTRARGMAISEMKGYLRQQYDVAAVFDLEAIPDPDTRDKALVMFAMDITLYHLHTILPGRYVPETRVTRYERAITWLTGVQAGRIEPGLPALKDYAGVEKSIFRSGGNEKQNWGW